MRPARRRPLATSLWLPRAVAALCCALPLVGGSRVGSAASPRGPGWRAAGGVTGARAREPTAQATAGLGGEVRSPIGGSLIARQRDEPDHEGHVGHEGAHQGGLREHGELGSHAGGQDEHQSGDELDSRVDHDGHGQDHDAAAHRDDESDSGAEPHDHGHRDSHGVHGHGATAQRDGELDSGAAPNDHGEHDSHWMHSNASSTNHEDKTYSMGKPSDQAGRDSREVHGHDAAAHHGADEEHGHARNGRGASSVAVGLVTTSVMIPLVIRMALSEGLLGTLTMKMLDTFVSIFLAVLWFSAFNQFIRTFKVGTWFPFAAEVVCFVQVMVLYYVAMTVAWLWRDRQVHLTTFTVCGAHYIAFAGIGATTSVQESLSAAVGDEWSVWSSVTSFAFVVMAIGFLMVVYALTWTFFRVDKTDDHSFQRSIDEMEIDITGLVSSFLATQAVRQAITGKFPQKHFFLQSAAWRSYPSSALQRNLMLAWSVMLTFVAAMVLPMFEEWSIKKGDRWTHLGFRFLKVFMVMMVAWGYLVWGSWQFYSQFNGDRMYGNMLFASLCTFVVLTVLYLLSMLQESDKVTSETARETNNITVSGLSLVAAWSWEHCFSLAFDVIGYRYDVGFEGLVPKLFMATAIPVILIPTYVKHVRAAVLAAEEAEEEEEEERKVRILERAGMTPQATGGPLGASRRERQT